MERGPAGARGVLLPEVLALEDSEQGGNGGRPDGQDLVADLGREVLACGEQEGGGRRRRGNGS